ncbi:MAG TPA: dienelactone hydrolase family protein [Burkholderiales bacterium]|nr:dienelactone hydrolase family protein [Burkholderiales bacterium]
MNDVNRLLGAELRSLAPKTDWTRREFFVSALASGFALAVQPVSAQTIVTDARGLTAGEVKVPVKDGEIPAYRAMPAEGRNFPLVLVVQEIFGVHEHIRDICRRLAKLGYMAVAPELYTREGDVSKLSDMKEIFAVVEKVPDAQVMSDLDAAVGWARHNGAHPAKLGVTGFCWGGRIVWLYCAHNPSVAAGVAWYGRLVGQPSELRPTYPIDVAPTLKVPVLGLYGGADAGIPVESVEQMRAALKKAGNASEIVVYPDTPHAFFADYRPSYRKEQAQDGWKRLQAWFRKYEL